MGRDANFKFVGITAPACLRRGRQTGSLCRLYRRLTHDEDDFIKIGSPYIAYQISYIFTYVLSDIWRASAEVKLSHKWSFGCVESLL